MNISPRMLVLALSIPAGLGGAVAALHQFGLDFRGWASTAELEIVRAEVRAIGKQADETEVILLNDLIARRTIELEMNSSQQLGYKATNKPIPEYLIHDAASLQQAIGWLTRKRDKIAND